VVGPILKQAVFHARNSLLFLDPTREQGAPGQNPRHLCQGRGSFPAMNRRLVPVSALLFLFAAAPAQAQ